MIVTSIQAMVCSGDSYSFLCLSSCDPITSMAVNDGQYGIPTSTTVMTLHSPLLHGFSEPDSTSIKSSVSVE